MTNKWNANLPGVARLGRDLLRFKLTDPGKLLLIGTLLAMAAGSLTLAVPIYHLFTAMICLLVLTWATALVLRPRVRITGDLPNKVVAGQAVTARFQVTNLSRFLPAYDVSLGLFHLPSSLKELQPGRIVRRIAPGQTVEMDVRLLPLRRGLYEVEGPRAFTTFPFNLFRSGRWSLRTESILVLPDFHPLADVDIPIGTRYQPGGISMTSNVGESPEYIGNRPYRPGDSLRRIDPRAWARLAEPVVREYNEEYYCRIALVLDTFIPRRRRRPPTGFAELEAGVSLTAAVADVMSRGEYIIDIFAAGPDLYVFRTGRHTAHFESVLEILACVDACRANPFETVGPALADELNNMSAVVFVMLDWDPAREALVRTAVESGCSVKLILVRDKKPTLGVETAEDWTGPVLHLAPEHVRQGALERI